MSLETILSSDPAVFAELANISEEYRRILATMGNCQPTPTKITREKIGLSNPVTNRVQMQF